MPRAESFTFGSASGTTLAFYFFLCLALLIGVAIYELLRNPAARRFGGGATTRRTALVAGAIVALLVFLGIYFSSLDGFYRLDVQGEEFRLVYILPGRSRILQRNDIADVRQRPAYKSLWQLIVQTHSGEQFASARPDFARVRMAQEQLRPTVRSPRRPD